MELNDETVEIFKQDAIYFIEINKIIQETKNAIKPFQDKLKKLMKEKKDLEKQLCETMSLEKNKLTRAEFSEHHKALEYKIKTSVVPIKTSDVKDKILLFFKTGPGSELSFNSLTAVEKGNELYEYIYSKDNRETVTTEIIKSKNMS
jgi:uncharacterized coiled-coil protein SlyX